MTESSPKQADGTFTIGLREKAKLGDVVSVHARMASGEHVRGIMCLVLSEGTFDGWVSSVRRMCGRDPEPWEIHSAQQSAFFYVVTSD